MKGFIAFLSANARWIGGGFLLCLFSSFGQTFFISLSGGEIRREIGLSNGEFGLIYMAATLASAATLPILGRTLDRHPAWCVAAATIVGLAGAALALSHATTVWLLLVSLYGLRLLGQGMMLQIAFTATGRWFFAQRGRAVSIVTLGNQGGEAVLPLLFAIVSAAVGWRGAWVAAALTLILVALPAIATLMMRERDPSAGPQSAVRAAARDLNVAEMLRRPSFYILCIGILAPPFIASAIFFHQVYLTELRGWPPALVASAFPVMSATIVVFSLISGALIDRCTATRILPFFLLPMTLACLVLANASGEWAIFTFMGLVGLSNGFSATLFGALWPELYGLRYLGAIRSVVVSLFVLSSAIGPGVTGILIDLAVPFPLQINAMALYCAVAAVLMFVVARQLAAQACIDTARADAAASAP